jgi:hypothetical protein
MKKISSTDEALMLFEECSIYRSDAMYTLREWESGRLKFPWEWARKH